MLHRHFMKTKQASCSQKCSEIRQLPLHSKRKGRSVHTHTHRWLVSTCPKEGRAVTLSWTLWPGQWHSIPSFRPAATSSVLMAPPQTHTRTPLGPLNLPTLTSEKAGNRVGWRTAGHSPLFCLLRGCPSVCGYMWAREKLNSLVWLRAIGNKKRKKRSGSGTHRPHREAISKLAMTDFGWLADFLLRFHFLVSTVTRSITWWQT